jgi:hypothetical protein
MGEADMQGLHRLMLMRWMDLARTTQSDSYEKMQKRLEKNISVLRARARDWRIRIDRHLVEAWEAPLRFAAFQEWHALTDLKRQEVQAASGWLQRQRCQERFHKEYEHQLRHKRHLLQLAHNIAEIRFRSALPRACFAWKLVVRNSTYGVLSVQRLSNLKLRCLMFVIFKSWRSTSVQELVTLGVSKYAQALVAFGMNNFMLRILLAWQGVASTSKTWIDAKRHLALQGIVPLILRAPRAALNQWRRNTQKNQPEVVRLTTLTEKECSLLKYGVLRAWFISFRDAQQDRWRIHANPNKDHFSLKNAVDIAFDEQTRQSRAQRMLAKWSNLGEHQRTLAPKYFSAWILSCLQDRSGARADHVACRLSDLSARYRADIERRLLRTIAERDRFAIMRTCWLYLVLATCKSVQKQRLDRRHNAFINTEARLLHEVVNDAGMRQFICRV